MSDNEYYSGGDSGSGSDSDSESGVIKFKPVTPVLHKQKQMVGGISNENTVDDDSDDDVSVSDVDHDDVIQIGGLGDDDDPAGEENDPDAVSSDDEDEAEEEEEEETNLEEEDENNPKKSEISKKNKTKTPVQIEIPSDDEDEDYDDSYLQKFDSEVTKNYINDFHPECFIQNYDEIAKLTSVVRDSNNIIIDPLHKTIPFLTKYEKARVIGQRAKQIETGARPFISVPENVIDSYVIADLELQQKRIPFIIRRPIPGGAFEYWNIRDLEMVGF